MPILLLLYNPTFRPRYLGNGWIKDRSAYSLDVFRVIIQCLLVTQECSQQLQSKQSILTKMTERVSKLTGGQDSPEHAEIDRLSHSWLELCHQANKLQSQREEDLQRSKEYHDCITAVEALFEQVSKEWDNLARCVYT